MEGVPTSGLTTDATRANGKTTRCMVKEYSPGLTAGCTRVTTMMIKNKVEVFSRGPMAGNTTENGLMENNMEKEFTILQKERSSAANGEKVKG